MYFLGVFPFKTMQGKNLFHLKANTQFIGLISCSIRPAKSFERKPPFLSLHLNIEISNLSLAGSPQKSI